ncbi:MAG: fimbrillin family protein [Bacteroidales bacterium]
MKTKIYGLFLSGLLLAGCTQTEEVAEQGNYPTDGLIRISTQVDAHLTKAEPQPYGGGDLALSVDYGAGDRFTVTNRKWTNHGDVWIPASQMLWKDATTAAKVYAYAPFREGVTAVTSVPFAVQTDQSAGLTASDLVVFKNESFVPGSSLSKKNELVVNFTHALSKLVVSLSYGNQWGNTHPEIAAVKINGMQTALTYDLIAQSQSLATENTSTASITTFKNTAIAISPTWEGIVVPQTVAEGTKLVTIELTNGDVYAYTLGTGGLTFEANKQYTINLRVGKDQVDLSGVTVGDWGGTVDLGDADSEIYFEDPLFVSRLIKDYNIPHTNGFIDPTDPATKAAIETITELDVSNPWDAGDDVKIKSLKGIEYFVNLTSLDCYNNQLTSLEVSNLTGLIRLDCPDNQLTSLNLTNLTELLALYCENNQLSSLNISLIINLNYLRCNNQKDANGESRVLTLTLTQLQKDAFSTVITEDVRTTVE